MSVWNTKYYEKDIHVHRELADYKVTNQEKTRDTFINSSFIWE
jgi:hypothetical protein